MNSSRQQFSGGVPITEFEKALLELLQGKTLCMKIGEISKEKGIDFLLAYGKKNNILFALASKLVESGCLNQKDLRKAKEVLTEEKKFYSKRIALAARAQGAFDEIRSLAIAMKSFFPFPYTDNDLDFVAVNGFEKCRRALERKSFTLEKSRSYLREPLKRFFSEQGNKDCFVHLHSAFSWNGIKYLDTEAVWKGKRNKAVGASLIPVPSATHDLLITAAHAMFENKCLYASDFLNLAFLAKSGKVDYERAISEAKGLNWDKAFVSFMKQSNALHKALFSTPLFPEKPFGGQEIRPEPEKIVFPFMLKETFSSSFTKLFLDMAKLRLSQLPRQFFSYTIVDFMLQRKAGKARKKLEAFQ